MKKLALPLAAAALLAAGAANAAAPLLNHVKSEVAARGSASVLESVEAADADWLDGDKRVVCVDMAANRIVADAGSHLLVGQAFDLPEPVDTVSRNMVSGLVEIGGGVSCGVRSYRP